MNLHIHSPNPGTWCDGRFMNLSPSILARYLNSEDIESLTIDAPGQPPLADRVNNPDNFSTPQHQMVAILLSYTTAINELIDQHPEWEKLYTILSAAMGLSAVLDILSSGAADTFTRDMVEECIPHYTDPRQDPIELTLNMDYLTKGDHSSQFHYVAHVVGRVVSSKEPTDLITVMSECICEFVRTSEDLTDWIVASILGMRVITDLSKSGMISLEAELVPLGVPFE